MSVIGSFSLSEPAWGDLAQVLVAVGTAALAVATWRMASRSRDLAEATENHVIETMKARADARSPHVVALPSIESVRVFTDNPWENRQAKPLAPGDHLSPGSREVWVMAHILLRNDGLPTASVTIPQRWAQWVDAEGPFALTQVVRPLSLGRHRYALGPGDAALLRVYGCNAADRWVEGYEGAAVGFTVSMVVMDQFDDGVADNIVVDFRGRPLELVGGSDPPEHRVVRDHGFGWTVRPVKRRHWRSKASDEEL